MTGNSPKRINGKVKWFNNAKGYGFIVADDSTEDLFAHYSMIEMDGYRTLKAGQRVEFEIQPSDKGSHAIHIKCHSEDSVRPSLESGVDFDANSNEGSDVKMVENEALNDNAVGASKTGSKLDAETA